MLRILSGSNRAILYLNIGIIALINIMTLITFFMAPRTYFEHRIMWNTLFFPWATYCVLMIGYASVKNKG